MCKGGFECLGRGRTMGLGYRVMLFEALSSTAAVALRISMVRRTNNDFAWRHADRSVLTTSPSRVNKYE